MNESDYVKGKLEAELKVEDITRSIKVNVPANGGKRKGKKVPSLVDYFTQRKEDIETLEKEGKAAAHVDHTLPPSITSFISDLKARARAERQGGAFMHMPPNDPKENLAAARRRVDEKMLQKETVELELRGLRTEEKMCQAARNSKDAAAAAIAEITLQKLRERRIPDVEQTLRKAKEAEADALRDLRNAKQTPMLGGLQKVARGSAEDRS